jgi:hypothetical protein
MTLAARPFIQVRWTAAVAMFLWLVGVASALSYELLAPALGSMGIEEGPDLLVPLLEQARRAMAGPTAFALNQWFGQTGSQSGAILAALFPAIGLGRVLGSGVFAYDLSFPLSRVRVGARYLAASLIALLATFAVGAGLFLVAAPIAGTELPPLWAQMGAAVIAFWAIHGFGSLSAALFGDILKGGGLPVAALLVLAIIAAITGADWLSPMGFVAGLAWSLPSVAAVTAWGAAGLALHAAALIVVSRREA